MLLGESVFSSLNQTAGFSTQANSLPVDAKFDCAGNELLSVESNLEIDSDVFDSVFSSNAAPLFGSETCSTQDLASIFSDNTTSMEIKQEPTDQLDAELLMLMSPVAEHIEPRSMSAPIGSLSLYTESTITTNSNEDSPHSKRSYSVMDQESTAKAAAKKSKKDKLGCTPYTRKQRAAPLQPVVPKGEDNASLKRARNTEAARRSRARKMERMSQLEGKCEGLIKENEALKMEIQALKNLLNKSN